MIDRTHLTLSVRAQCQLLSISRWSFYDAPQREAALNPDVMLKVDKSLPYNGSGQPVHVLRLDRPADAGQNQDARLGDCSQSPAGNAWTAMPDTPTTLGARCGMKLCSRPCTMPAVSLTLDKSRGQRQAAPSDFDRKPKTAKRVSKIAPAVKLSISCRAPDDRVPPPPRLTLQN